MKKKYFFPFKLSKKCVSRHLITFFCSFLQFCRIQWSNAIDSVLDLPNGPKWILILTTLTILLKGNKECRVKSRQKRERKTITLSYMDDNRADFYYTELGSAISFFIHGYNLFTTTYALAKKLKISNYYKLVPPSQ